MAFHEPFHWSALSVCSTLFWLAKKMATTKEELEESNAIGGGGGTRRCDQSGRSVSFQVNIDGSAGPKTMRNNDLKASQSLFLAQRRPIPVGAATPRRPRASKQKNNASRHDRDVAFFSASMTSFFFLSLPPRPPSIVTIDFNDNSFSFFFFF